jgi:hypothetical protein
MGEEGETDVLEAQSGNTTGLFVRLDRIHAILVLT